MNSTKKTRKTKNKKNTVSALARKRTTSKSFQLPTINLYYLALFLTFVGLIIRIWKVDVLSLWVDEYQVSGYINNVLNGTSFFETQHRKNLVFYWITYAICKVGGINEFTLRLQSVLFGTATLITLFFLGKKLFNTYVGALTTFIAAFSLYLVFWSRTAYNYGMTSFAFPLLLLVFLYAYEPNNFQGFSPFFKRFQLNRKFLFLLPLAIVFAFLSHPLCIFFFFAFGIYCIFCSINNLFDKHSNIHKYINKYVPIAILSIIGGFLLFNPTISKLITPIIGLVWEDPSSIIPNMERVIELWETEKFKVFNIYFDLVKYDFSLLYFAGLAGFITSFFIKRKSGIFLLSFFWGIFLLLSFVYRAPATQNYLIYIYTLFLISNASFLYFLFIYLPKTYLPKFESSNWKALFYIAPFLIVASFFRYSELNTLINVKNKSGLQVSKKLSHWSYVNWKDAVNYLKENMKDGDVVLSTVPGATNHYMNWHKGGAFQFRQTYLESYQTVNYVNYNTPSSNLDAHTIENLNRTIAENPRGWLLADYYLNTIYISPEARNVVYRNMNFHFDAVPSGDVKVFSWNHAEPRDFSGRNILISLGKNLNSMYSKSLNFEVKANELKNDFLTFNLAAQAVNSTREGFFVINGQTKYYIPTTKSKDVELVKVNVSKEYLNEGTNTIQFGYNTDVKYDPRKGFAIHSITF